ncbi:hypothetical protein KKG61_08435 [bacterium]|nr:hypothetical protein [bacterium]
MSYFVLDKKDLLYGFTPLEILTKDKIDTTIILSLTGLIAPFLLLVLMVFSLSFLY